MDKTFINIGKAIRKSNIAKSKFHPMVQSRNLAENIISYDVIVNMNNETVEINPSEIVPKLKIIKFAISIADTVSPYLCGSTLIKKKDFLEQISFNSFEKKYVKEYGIEPNSILYKYRDILEKSFQLFTELYENIKDNETIKEIALSVEVILGEKTDSIQSFEEFLNEMDSMFLRKNFVKGKGYTFLCAFYSMFNYGKFDLRGIKTMCDGSIPYFSEDDFLSLYYARNIFSKKDFAFGDYSASIFPSYENMTFEDIECLSSCGKNIFNFELFCNAVQNFIENKSERDFQLKKMIPLQLKFDLYYRCKAKLGDNNILRLSGVRYSQILGIKNLINKSYKLIYEDKDISDKFLITSLFCLYKDYNGKNDRYNSVILKTLQNIYQGNYRVPPQAEFCVLDNSQHVARIKEENFRKEWNDNFRIYKFLKTMENINFVPELVNNDSYKLGIELSKFESGWRKDRENLKKTIQQFTGNVSRRVYEIKDVFLYYIDLCERLQRNKLFQGEHNELIRLLHSIKDENFEKNKFIMGYFTGKNTFNVKETESCQEIENQEEN